MNIALVDHLVYAVPDLNAAVEDLSERLGVRAAPGGRHLGEGTRNSLIALGRDVYLEIIARDPDQASPGKPRWFGIDTLTAPRIAGWAVKATDLEGVAGRSAAAGLPQLGPVIDGSRHLSDRVSLRWRFTDPHIVVEHGIVPFFIDWSDAPHPSRAAARGASLIGLRAEHPDPETVRKILAGLALDLAVDIGAKPALIATLRTPRGLVELR